MRRCNVFARHPSMACLWTEHGWDPPLDAHGRYYREHVRRPDVGVVDPARVVGGGPNTRSPLVLRHEFAALTVPELLARAAALGYKEQPAPNAGVRKMRLINFLKARSRRG